MTEPTTTEPTQRLSDLQRISIAITGGVTLWFIAYCVFAASAGLDQQAKVIALIVDNYALIVLEAALGWILLLAVVPRSWKFLIPVSLVVALPTLLAVLFGLGLGLIYLDGHRTAAVTVCCLFWLVWGWLIWSWGNSKKKKGTRQP